VEEKEDDHTTACWRGRRRNGLKPIKTDCFECLALHGDLHVMVEVMFSRAQLMPRYGPLLVFLRMGPVSSGSRLDPSLTEKRKFLLYFRV